MVNAGAFLVYPAFTDQLTRASLTADSSSKAFPAGASALRKFQVDNFASEVSLLNPETIFSLIGLLLTSAAMSAASAQNRRNLAYCAVIVSLLALINFSGRFIPDQPMELLKRLKIGGLTQQQAIELVRENKGRILDRDMQVFPYAMGALYRVHTVHGYSALQPLGIFHRPADSLLPVAYGADVSVGLSKVETLLIEDLSSVPLQGRFHSIDDEQSIQVSEERLNSLRLNSAKGPLTPFYRTDTPYPGWTVSPSDRVTMFPKEVFTFFSFQSITSPSQLVLFYKPTYLSRASFVASVAAVTLLVMLLPQVFLRRTEL
jgi:hypothetical protein